MAKKHQFMRVDDETKHLAKQVVIHYQVQAPVYPSFNEVVKIALKEHLKTFKDD